MRFFRTVLFAGLCCPVFIFHYSCKLRFEFDAHANTCGARSSHTDDCNNSCSGSVCSVSDDQPHHDFHNRSDQRNTNIAGLLVADRGTGEQCGGAEYNFKWIIVLLGRVEFARHIQCLSDQQALSFAQSLGLDAGGIH